MITNQSTNQAANTCLLYRWTGCQTEMFYPHPAGQFLIQANGRSACKEVSVLNGARRFINVFTRAYHWLISAHVSITSVLILFRHLRLRSYVCVTNVIHLILLFFIFTILTYFMLLKYIIKFTQGMKFQKILKLILV
jgi:hypothetical protein